MATKKRITSTKKQTARNLAKDKSHSSIQSNLMPANISFLRLRQMLSAETVQWEVVDEYVEFDPNSSIPKLRLRAGVIRDLPLQDFDIDKAIYAIINAENRRRAAARRSDPAFTDRVRVVAEGDSWFHYPVPWVEAIAEQLAEDDPFKDRLNVLDIATGGDTLREIFQARESLFNDLREHNATFLLLSAGGNDFVKDISQNVEAYEEGRPLDQYLTSQGKRVLQNIGLAYEALLTEVTNHFPGLHILSYGYDYPRPDKDGFYIGKVLHAKNIPEAKMIPIMAHMIDKLNVAIETTTQKYDRARFINCRSVVHSILPWLDDMHPRTSGFTKLAEKFAENIKG